MTKYENQKLEKQALVSEDCYFINCSLEDCDLFFSGGDVEWVNTRFENCRWHWRGPAAKMFQLLNMLGMLKTQATPQQPATSSKMMN